ncbi:PLP-dependent aminotransferase family protein [Reinekea marinisedimentorum]|uniref:GntR family transcriptional regulator/MocR family aminotransferase n=1 Tax=Reinekea marinisedimentorum TaxID=230495 RepID=A0A4R3ICM6_9GAMM|nr:PLP-dependent aminotransferase family protein [Reinekea marinisedimentorum]TCS42365.1 GntR family transcriptional regulator/MocR family aminotransferase [Reinekea marinisedimentorum]
MDDLVINIEFKPGKSYQQQIREKLVQLIQQDYFGEQTLPSSRNMAAKLGVSRNTVVLVYESLVDEGYLLARERQGFFVNREVFSDAELSTPVESTPRASSSAGWHERFSRHPSAYSRIAKNKQWMDFEYPFIYGQIDANDFPIYQWRECARIAQSRNNLQEWVEDVFDDDDPELVTQIRHQVLSKRGISAQPEEVLITMGTQNSMFLLASLLADSTTTVAIEEPGLPDFHHIFRHAGAQTKAVPIDKQGIKTGAVLTGCDYVCVTPSHHYPTTVTMTMERRKALLAQAIADNFVIIEDDYDSEVNFCKTPLPALKSLDNSGHVVYVGSLSKSVSPGLRIGYIVGDRELITELRALRRLCYRHPPTNNQRVAARFIAQGFHESHIRRMRRLMEEKWQLMDAGLKQYLPGCKCNGAPGSFCFWIELPKKLPARLLVEKAAQRGIIVESGDALFAQQNPPGNFIRLGYTAIAVEKIEPGLALLGEVITELSSGLPAAS